MKFHDFQDPRDMDLFNNFQLRSYNIYGLMLFLPQATFSFPNPFRFKFHAQVEAKKSKSMLCAINIVGGLKFGKLSRNMTL